jgi:ankyrin repeat protein
MAFLGLPNEIIIDIVAYLEQGDIYSILRVNKRLHLLFAEYLLRYNIRHRRGRALIWAATKGHISTARKLVHLGADVNRQINLRVPELARPTLLHIAARRGNLAMVKLLFEIGANPNERDSLSRAPLYWSLMTGHEEVSLEISWRMGNLSEFIIDLDQNLTPLHVASCSGLTSLISYYVAVGIDIGAKDKDGNTPLDLAKTSLRRGDWRPTTDIRHENVVETTRALVALGEDLATAHEFAALCGSRRTRDPFDDPFNDSFNDSSHEPEQLHIGRAWSCNTSSWKKDGSFGSRQA